MPLPSLTPKMPAELAQGHLDADTGEEADQNRVRQEVGDEAQANESRHDQEDRAHDCGQACHRNPLWRAGYARRGDPGKTGRHDRCGGRVCAHDQMARRSEHRERSDRQHERVQARDHRHLRDLRVAHDLGHCERGQGRAGDQVGRQARPVERHDASEQPRRGAGF